MIKRLALAAAVTWSLPAWAGAPYVGIEGGISSGRESDIDEVVQYRSAADPDPAETEFDDVFGVGYKGGHDIGLVGGYDFGPLRFELELAHKRAGLSDVTPDENFDTFVTSLNSALHRPDEGGLPALAASDFPVEGRMRVSSAMANGLVDVPIVDRVAGYGGGGLGQSWVRAFGDEDGALAWQWIAGIRYSVGRKIELGLKYRYFNSGIVKLRHPGVNYEGSGQVGQAIGATLRPEIEGEIRTRSLLTTLTLNF